MSKYTTYWKDYISKCNQTITLCNFFIKKLQNRKRKEKILDVNQNFLPDFLFVWCFSMLEWYFKSTKDSILTEHEKKIPLYTIETHFKNLYGERESKEPWYEIIAKIQKLLYPSNTLTTHHTYTIIKSAYDQRNWITHRWQSWKTYQDVIDTINHIKSFMQFSDQKIKKVFKFL